MTGAGVTLYLLLYLQSYNLAAITVAAFAPLIGFHFAIDRLFSKKKHDGNKNSVNNTSKWGPTVPSGRLIKIRSLAK